MGAIIMKRIDDLPSEEAEPRQDEPPIDKVEEASEESFPAIFGNWPVAESHLVSNVELQVRT
jgi:hypothetical protein